MTLQTKYIITGIVISLLVGAGAGYVSSQFTIARYREEVDRLEKENLEFQKIQVQLQEELDVIREQLNNVTTDLSLSKNSLKNLQKELEGALASYAALEISHEVLEEEYNALVGAHNRLLIGNACMPCWTSTPPKIDGFAEDGEWQAFQGLVLGYWATFNLSKRSEAASWDTGDKIALLSLMRDVSHLYLCMKIQDDYLSQDFQIDAMFVYLDDGSGIIDMRHMLWDTSKGYRQNSWMTDGFTNQTSGEYLHDFYVGGTSDGRGRYSHTGIGSQGAGGIYTIELDLPLRMATGDICDVGIGTIKVEIQYVEATTYTPEGYHQKSSHWKTEPLTITIP